MATRQLLFNGLAIGDHFLKVETANVTLTPPVRRTGLFQDFAAINSDSRNLLHARRFFVALKRADNLDLDQAISQVQELQGLVGDITIKDDITLKMLCMEWTIEIVSAPGLREGFGGRFAQQLVITAIGDMAPQYF